MKVKEWTEESNMMYSRRCNLDNVNFPVFMQYTLISKFEPISNKREHCLQNTQRYFKIPLYPYLKFEIGI